MEILGALILVIVAPAVVMAAAAAKGKPSLPFFAFRFVLCLAAIVVPIAVFLLSALMVPEWKGDCRHGWIDCFFAGKLALTPLVFWAAWALYHFQVTEAPGPLTKSVGQGLFVGALVSCVCCVHGFISTSGDMMLWLIMPLYIALWYSGISICSMLISGLKFMDYVWAFCISIPFWMGSVLWSWNCYQKLPDHAPSCFVVTAASRGHRRIVGPFFPITRRGECRLANKQLLTFWRFEALWSIYAPWTHAVFRSVYNRIGPIIAGRMRSPLVSDVVYLALKPSELFLRLSMGLVSV